MTPKPANQTLDWEPGDRTGADGLSYIRDDDNMTPSCTNSIYLDSVCRKISRRTALKLPVPGTTN